MVSDDPCEPGKLLHTEEEFKFLSLGESIKNLGQNNIGWKKKYTEHSLKENVEEIPLAEN